MPPALSSAAFRAHRLRAISSGCGGPWSPSILVRCRDRAAQAKAITVETGTLVETFAITPANVNDRRAGPDALPDNSDAGEVLADSAYRGSHIAR